MLTLEKIINETQLPCFVRKASAYIQTFSSNEFNNHANSSVEETTPSTTTSAPTTPTEPTAPIVAQQTNKTESSFDSLDLLNDENYDNNSSSNEKTNSSIESDVIIDENDINYITKIITANCAFARKYEVRNVEEYMNHKYGCNTSIDISNENIIHNSAYDLTNIPYDDYIIPSNYEGLLEVLPDYSKQIFDTLDHETDVISLASRLKQPQNYYVAKPIKLFEIVVSDTKKSISPKSREYKDNYDDLIRKWHTFDVGTIFLATKVLMVIYPPEHKRKKSLCEKLTEAFFCKCKNKNKVRFEVAIEFKIVKDFEQLINTYYNERKKSMHVFNIDLKQIEKLRNESSCNVNDEDRCFYLPIYHDPNENIDLIPIASTNSLQMNSLQNIFNLMHKNEENTVLDSPIRVKIRVEDSFRNKDSTNTSDLVTSQLLNQSSFYEIYARKTCKLLFGYNLKTNNLILYEVDSQNENYNLRYKFELLDEDYVAKYYNCNYLNELKTNKINQLLNDFILNFQYNIHKIELDHRKCKNNPLSNATSVATYRDRHHRFQNDEQIDDDGYVSYKHSKCIHWHKHNNLQYTTFPKSKLIKYKKLFINGKSNECFNQNFEFDDGDGDGENNQQQQSHNLYKKHEIRTRSKSLPGDSDELNLNATQSKTSFTNMSLIIENNDDIKKTKF